MTYGTTFSRLSRIALASALALGGATAFAQDAGAASGARGHQNDGSATPSQPKALSQGNYENKTMSDQPTRSDGATGMTSGSYAKKKQRAEQKANRPQTANDSSTDRNRSVNQGTEGVDANPVGSKAK